MKFGNEIYIPEALRLVRKPGSCFGFVVITPDWGGEGIYVQLVKADLIAELERMLENEDPDEPTSINIRVEPEGVYLG